MMTKNAASLAVLAASAAVFLTALDQTVVVTALPQIIVDLQIPINELDRAAWIISGYLLGYVIAMPLMGRVSDLYGRRRVFMICLSVFAVGSLLCALAPVLGGSIPLDFLQNLGIDVSSPGLIWLVVARFVQAAGGGAVVPVAMAVAGDYYFQYPQAGRDANSAGRRRSRASGGRTARTGLLPPPEGKYTHQTLKGQTRQYVEPAEISHEGSRRASLHSAVGSYNEKRGALALGLIGMVTEAGGVLGPLYGSVIVQYGGFTFAPGSLVLQVSGWQTIFLLNLPIVAVLLFLIWRFVPSARAEQGDMARQREASTQDVRGTSSGRRGRIDFVGALLLGASLVCLSMGLSQEAAQISPATPAVGSAPIENNLWLIAAALVLLAGFIMYEVFVDTPQRTPARGGEEDGSGAACKRGRESNREDARDSMGQGDQKGDGRRGHFAYPIGRVWPVVEMSLFERVSFSAAALVSLLVGAALIIAMADIPIFIATVLGRPAIDSGLALLRLTAMIPIGALLGGWLCSLISCRLTAVLGLIPTAIGFWLMHLWPLDVGWTQITVSTIIGGLGFGLVIAPIGTTAINAASSRQIGMASSVVTVLRMVGMILGLAALTSWGLGRFRALAAAFHPPAGIPVFSAAYNTLYSQYLVASAHEVYTAIFLAAGVLCLVAVLPAFFLDDREPSPYLIRRINTNTK